MPPTASIRPPAAQLFADEGPPVWGGAILWRGTAWAEPFLSGATMAMAGHETQKFVTYPISRPDPDTGRQLVNFIAELKTDPSAGWRREDYNRRADLDDFLPRFEDWRFRLARHPGADPLRPRRSSNIR